MGPMQIQAIRIRLEAQLKSKQTSLSAQLREQVGPEMRKAFNDRLSSCPAPAYFTLTLDRWDSAVIGTSSVMNRIEKDIKKLYATKAKPLREAVERQKLAIHQLAFDLVFILEVKDAMTASRKVEQAIRSLKVERKKAR
jgi:hypothetical protein